MASTSGLFSNSFFKRDFGTKKRGPTEEKEGYFVGLVKTITWHYTAGNDYIENFWRSSFKEKRKVGWSPTKNITYQQICKLLVLG